MDLPCCDGCLGEWTKDIPKKNTLGISFLEMMSVFFSQFTAAEMELLVILVRRIWLRRNTFMFEGIFTPRKIVVSSAIEAHQEYKLCHQKMQPVVEVLAPIPVRKWQPPPVGVVKVNWDAAVNRREGCVGVGIVARDCEGMFLGAKSLFCSINADPTVAEAMAVTHAVIFCQEVGFLT
jgi:hypothetical protein